MGKWDEAFDGSNAHQLDREGAVDPQVVPNTLASQKLPLVQVADLGGMMHLEMVKDARKKCRLMGAEIDWLIAEVERLTAENGRMREALLNVTDCQGVSCCDQEENVYQLAREALAEAVRSVCEWGPPQMLHGRLVQSLGCRRGETIVAASQITCPMCGKQVKHQSV